MWDVELGVGTQASFGDSVDRGDDHTLWRVKLLGQKGGITGREDRAGLSDRESMRLLILSTP